MGTKTRGVYDGSEKIADLTEDNVTYRDNDKSKGVVGLMGTTIHRSTKSNYTTKLGAYIDRKCVVGSFVNYAIPMYQDTSSSSRNPLNIYTLDSNDSLTVLCTIYCIYHQAVQQGDKPYITFITNNQELRFLVAIGSNVHIITNNTQITFDSNTQLAQPTLLANVWNGGYTGFGYDDNGLFLGSASGGQGSSANGGGTSVGGDIGSIIQ